ncbi:MAG: DUF1365 domain-containing protein [Leptospiraceae bacterium]|nr:DUF1365 domain-containing protein [Leptospiraceae bacterium]MDW7975698.1 DUF1365 domain-containing protein [Leptospiraceae bacterium]
MKLKEFQSSLYEVTIVHRRVRYTQHLLKYRIFMFYIDIDEIEQLDKKIKLFSYNRKNIYSLYDKDHFYFYESKASIKENLERYFKEKQLIIPDKIYLLTNLRFLNYVFNPVSFYYCYKDNQLLYILSEVNNTFNEQKPILIPISHSEKKNAFLYFHKNKKDFYVSPFVKYDTDLLFYFTEPSETLLMRVDSGYFNQNKQEHHVIATMYGKRKKLTDKELIKLTMKYPFVTFKVIFGIHYHALLLWLKQTPYFTKRETDQILRKIYLKNGGYTYEPIKNYGPK